jgi:hypothetical protein
MNFKNKQDADIFLKELAFRLNQNGGDWKIHNKKGKSIMKSPTTEGQLVLERGACDM